MRFLEHDEADDPILSMVNLIDLFLVVIGILLIVIVQNPLNPFSQDKVVVVENPGEADMRMLVKDGKEAEALPGQRRDRRRAGQPRRGDLPLGRRTDDLRAGERRGGRQVATRTAGWDFCPEFPDNGRFPFLLVLAVEVKVNFLDNLRLEARFDDFTVIADQPIRYKGDGSAPGPFDYFLASSALCAAYFVKLYCQTRNIPADNIRLSQNNIVDPENRYRQIFKIQVELPADISEKDRQGILRSIDRCTVKKVVQTGPEFVIEEVDNLDADAQALLMPGTDAAGCTRIPGKDLPLEQTIANLSAILAGLGMKIEIASWRNIVPNVWSLHIRDAQSPMCFTNGKGASKESALASALGEFIERLNCNFFYNDQYWGEEIANAAFVHYPDERWFKPGRDDALPLGLLDGHCLAIYDPDDGCVARTCTTPTRATCSAVSAPCPSCASPTARWCISPPT